MNKLHKKFVIAFILILCVLGYLVALKAVSTPNFDDNTNSISDDSLIDENDILMSLGNEESQKKDNTVIINDDKSKVGEIYISSLNLRYPIMYSSDNNFYLTHNSDGDKDKNGAIFIDAASNGSWSKLNLIHGHNMNSGAMFGNLDKYKNEKWCKNNLYIKIKENDVEYTYKIFSVFTFNSKKEELYVSFDDLDKYEDYFYTLSKKSWFKLDKPGRYDTVIMLNTCSYSYDGEHLLVCAYRSSDNASDDN